MPLSASDGALDGRLGCAMYVEFTGTRFTLKQLQYGVPQGSVLRPPLSIITLKYLSKCLNYVQFITVC